MTGSARLARLAAAVGVASLAHAVAAGPAFDGFAKQILFQTTDSRPFSVAVGDFNRDDIPDLAAACFGEAGDPDANHVSIFLGVGDGTFEPARFVVAEDTVAAVVAADFNGDGCDDLAAANFESDSVSVFLAVGDGTFAPQQTYDGGERPVGIATADFDDDGDLDLALSENEADRVTVLRNAGDGTFAARQFFPVGEGPEGVAAGDLDSDGVQDLAVANFGAGTLSLLLGDGDGTFTPGLTLDPAGGARSPVIADLNDDGETDLLIANPETDSLTFYPDAGDGDFVESTAIPTVDFPHALDVGDVNGDGSLDIVLASISLLEQGIAVHLGSGDGSFSSAQSSLAGEQPNDVLLADLNADGAPDVVTADPNFDSISVLLNQTVGQPPVGVMLASPSDGASGLALPEFLQGWPRAADVATLEWQAPPGFVTGYTVTLALDPSLSDVVLEQAGVQQTRFPIPAGVLEAGQTYHWTVAAENTAGSASAANGPFSFATAVPADLNNDGVVNATDLGVLLAGWGPVD